MSTPQSDPLLQAETTCGTLLYELQIIWDEVGETDADRDEMLLELERECLEVYRRKVDQANRCRAQLRQTIADSEAELAAITSAMGERPMHIGQSDQNAGSLKEEIRKILPQLEEMKKRKIERINQFVEVSKQVQIITNEIYESTKSTEIVVDESDLSLRKLEELLRQLNELQKEKNGRLKQVEDHLSMLNSLCLVMGMDFKLTVTEVHPGLSDSEGFRSVSNRTIEQLTKLIKMLQEVKIQRMQRLQDLATTMLELWNLMDTPIEEQQLFQNVTHNIAASEHEITEPNTLSADYIKYVEAEVSRLEELKYSKMKEFVLKKRLELDEISRKTHLVVSQSAIEDAIGAIESGAVDASTVLEQIELQIAKVKEEAFSRKEILERVEKWLMACDEECWLEEYNRDENRYNAGKGAHLTLKRAEKARSLVNKLPGMVEALASKTMAWEKETEVDFFYDGIRLLSMLEEYTILRHEKEQERRRLQDQKKLQGRLIAEQEALYGSKPSPAKPQSSKKGPRHSTGGASSRRVSLGGAMLPTSKPDSLHSAKATPQTPNKTERMFQNHFNHHHDDAIPAFSALRRGLDIADIPFRKHFSGVMNANELESPLVRKPFSPMSSTVSSKASSITNMVEDNGETIQKMLPANDLSYATPLKRMSLADEENRTPKVSAPMQTAMTPVSTVPVPMQMAMTPAPPIPFSTSTTTATKAVQEIPKEIEHSFEERRFAFVRSETLVHV